MSHPPTRVCASWALTFAPRRHGGTSWVGTSQTRELLQEGAPGWPPTAGLSSTVGVPGAAWLPLPAPAPSWGGTREQSPEQLWWKENVTPVLTPEWAAARPGPVGRQRGALPAPGGWSWHCHPQPHLATEFGRGPLGDLLGTSGSHVPPPASTQHPARAGRRGMGPSPAAEA